MANKKQTPKTIKVKMTESYSTWVVHESITVTVADYPELEGMSEEKIKEYIQQNASDMKPTDDTYFSDLYEELIGQNVIREKITNEDTEIYFD